MAAPLMPKATAVWLVDNTSLTFDQIADYCELHRLELQGIADGDDLHPMQSAFSEYHGLQCGFCTPGMILAGIDMVSRNPDPSPQEIREEMGGNICRCTGYQKIVESVQAAAAAMSAEGGSA